MPKLKSVLALATLVAVLAVGASTAVAATLPQPVLGPWKTGLGGFTLKKSGSKVMLSNFHLTFACEERTVKATVLGSYPLKVFTRGGYSTCERFGSLDVYLEGIGIDVEAARRRLSAALLVS